jgi:hypothetical protein
VRRLVTRSELVPIGRSARPGFSTHQPPRVWVQGKGESILLSY